MDNPIYLDTSALVKLVMREHESEYLEAFLEPGQQGVSSELTEVELTRAVLRHKPECLSTALEVLAQTILLPITAMVLRDACRLKPATLRSLDAIHLATALGIQADLSGLVSYDNRMLEASRAAGIDAFSPGFVR